MKMEKTNVLDWQQRYGTEDACAAALRQQRGPDGFVCPRCGHDQGYFITSRRVTECAQCKHPASLTAGTLFHSTNLPLTKSPPRAKPARWESWFWAIYLSASDKGGISALRLSKQIDVSWLSAHRMLRKIRTAMGHRDSVCRLTELIEIDDAGDGAAGESVGAARKEKRPCWWRSKIAVSAPGLWPCRP